MFFFFRIPLLYKDMQCILRNRCLLCLFYFLLNSKFYRHFYGLKTLYILQFNNMQEMMKKCVMQFPRHKCKSKPEFNIGGQISFVTFLTATIAAHHLTIETIQVYIYQISFNVLQFLYSSNFLRKFIIGCHDLSKTRYVGYTVLIGKTERKKNENLQKILKEMQEK